MRMSAWKLIPAVSLIAGLAAAFAGPARAADETVVDPWEPMNRGIYGFNDWTDRHLLKPVAKGYKKITPSVVQRGINNFFDNVGTPAVAINQLLQGKPGRSLSDGGRFLVNTTLGLGGLFDVATRVGLAEHEEDFDQTFARWGMGRGNYMVLPFLGASTVRHSGGRILDYLVNPLRFLSPTEDALVVSAISVIDLRAELLSLDPLLGGDEYLFLRDSYLQRRDYLINDGVYEDDPFLDDSFGDEL